LILRDWRFNVHQVDRVLTKRGDGERNFAEHHVAGTTINSGTYISATRTYTLQRYSAPTTYNYDMVNTSNAPGLPEKMFLIDADDSNTRSSMRYYEGAIKILANL
jgi:hypothetical protein